MLYARRQADPVSGDRIGFIVSKAVGVAVKRNLAKRHLRAIARELRSDEGNLDIVVRALPGAAELSWDELRRQVASGWSAIEHKLVDR